MKKEPTLTAHELLLMAAAVHNLGPWTNLGCGPSTVKVMRQALHWAGLLHGEIKECFESYDECPPITQCYEALISMMPQSRPAEILFEVRRQMGRPG